MQMSVGTIVTIVLLMAVLVLGIVLTQDIFKGAKSAVDLTEDQLIGEINKLFSEEKKLVIYPGTTEIEMERDKTWGIGIGVRNRLSGTPTAQNFNYNVSVDDPDIRDNCGINIHEVETWIRGKSGQGIPLPPGNEVQVEKVLFDIPENAPLCSIKIRVDIKIEGSTYDQDSFFLTIV